MGFKRIESDRSVYAFTRDDVKIIAPVYIDDITFASPSSTALDTIVVELRSYFKLRDLGETSYLLGIKISRDWDRRPSPSARGATSLMSSSASTWRAATLSKLPWPLAMS